MGKGKGLHAAENQTPTKTEAGLDEQSSDPSPEFVHGLTDLH